MNFTLHLTENCNLACTYCHLQERSAKDAPRAMTMEVIRQAVALSMTHHKSTGLCFYGGEPLLERQLIYDAVAYCEEIRQETGHDFQYRLNTNGLLLDEEFIIFAKNHNIRLGISHDGRGQDSCRPTRHGRGSLPLLAPKIPLLLTHLPDTMVMLTLHPKVVDTFAQSMDDLYDAGFRHIHATPAYGRFVRWDEGSLDALRAQYKTIAVLYAQWSERGTAFYFSPFDSKIASHVHPQRHCQNLCHIGRGQYSVAVDGTLYPCSSFVGEGGFVLGNVATGFSPEAAAKTSTHTTPDTCRDCALRARCTNACGCLNLVETGAVNTVSPMQCAHEQMLIEIADSLAENLFQKGVPAFLEKHYGGDAKVKGRVTHGAVTHDPLNF